MAEARPSTGIPARRAVARSRSWKSSYTSRHTTNTPERGPVSTAVTLIHVYSILSSPKHVRMYDGFDKCSQERQQRVIVLAVPSFPCRTNRLIQSPSATALSISKHKTLCSLRRGDLESTRAQPVLRRGSTRPSSPSLAMPACCIDTSLTSPPHPITSRSRSRAPHVHPVMNAFPPIQPLTKTLSNQTEKQEKKKTPTPQNARKEYQRAPTYTPQSL